MESIEITNWLGGLLRTRPQPCSGESRRTRPSDNTDNKQREGTRTVVQPTPFELCGPGRLSACSLHWDCIEDDSCSPPSWTNTDRSPHLKKRLHQIWPLSPTHIPNRGSSSSIFRPPCTPFPPRSALMSTIKTCLPSPS